MKNRTSLSYDLDCAGIVALAGAAGALGGALWFSAMPLEATLLAAFKVALVLAVGALLAARVSDITRILRTAPTLDMAAANAAPSNVETLPTRDDLPRAA